MGIPQYFSTTYAEARQKFLEAAPAAGAVTLEAHVNPNAKGANGEEAALDVARFGERDAENLLIVCSGTHGNEAFCGSGCQIGLIKEGVIDARPRTVAMLLAHAVNPFGFSHVRRVTEENVDLNRNFRDFSKPLPENPRYAEIHDLLVPSDWDGPGRAAAEAALAAWRDANGGMPAYQAVVAGGQYGFPDGLFFGGRRAAWSNETFRAIVKKHGAAAKRVAVIDIHSGLGPAGYGEPISILASEAPGFARAQGWWGEEVTSTSEGTSKSPPVTGPLIGSIEESLPGAEATAIGLEFGTVALPEVLEAIRGDNWLYARGLKAGLAIDSALARDIKTKIRDALFVDADDWREKVCARTADFALKAYRGLTSEISR
ncbi:MAG TPA: M14 family metallopeptidase [Roseiarcus sp.]|nr:M14 family metallopeptidase [Roseiarcus sp.]